MTNFARLCSICRTPCGRFELEMNSHLGLAAAVAALSSPRTPPEAESARSAAAGAAGSAI
ncbi:hypothetical protein [Streptomyces sp. NPDC059080]|uniref:hypothetical protein n=1 Tax=Streptomyces sp. NPDC059080 TaxID=3346718 RepID=UPI00368D0D23